MNNENFEKVEAMVKTMGQYASGDFFTYNNVCGDIHIFYVMPDGERIFEGDIEIATISDYFNNFHDVNYVVDSDKNFRACRVLVACGGPNIFVDTWAKEVQLFWWADTATVDIPEKLCDDINNFFETIYNC